MDDPARNPAELIMIAGGTEEVFARLQAMLEEQERNRCRHMNTLIPFLGTDLRRNHRRSMVEYAAHFVSDLSRTVEFML